MMCQTSQSQLPFQACYVRAVFLGLQMEINLLGRACVLIHLAVLPALRGILERHKLRNSKPNRIVPSLDCDSKQRSRIARADSAQVD